MPHLTKLNQKRVQPQREVFKLNQQMRLLKLQVPMMQQRTHQIQQSRYHQMSMILKLIVINQETLHKLYHQITQLMLAALSNKIEEMIDSMDSLIQMTTT